MSKPPTGELNPNRNVGYASRLQGSSISRVMTESSGGGGSQQPIDRGPYNVTSSTFHKRKHSFFLLTMFPAEDYCGVLKMCHIVLWGRKKKRSEQHKDEFGRLSYKFPPLFCCPPSFSTQTLRRLQGCRAECDTAYKSMLVSPLARRSAQDWEALRTHTL